MHHVHLLIKLKIKFILRKFIFFVLKFFLKYKLKAPHKKGTLFLVPFK
jgi:hypothetical protein